ncbi:MAG: hypothetical protein R3D67_09920 [Hyphomicrobiaceae bacterium]
MAGAFRFAHAMVRDSYHVNLESGELGMDLGLRQSSRHGQSPSVNWVVDWANFFPQREEGGGQMANTSRRLGPKYATALSTDEEMPSTLEGVRRGNPELEAIDKGLAIRDFLSASYAGLWSVPALLTEIRQRLEAVNSPLAGELHNYATTWQEPIRAWIGRSDMGGFFERDDGGQEQLDMLARDPPLPFFVLFEAAHEFVDGRPLIANGDDADIPGQGGARLGPLGSIILAETFYSALRRGPRLSQDESVPLADRLKEQIQAYGDRGGIAVDGLAELWTTSETGETAFDTMFGLISFLQKKGFPTNQGNPPD